MAKSVQLMTRNTRLLRNSLIRDFGRRKYLDTGTRHWSTFAISPSASSRLLSQQNNGYGFARAREPVSRASSLPNVQHLNHINGCQILSQQRYFSSANSVRLDEKQRDTESSASPTQASTNHENKPVEAPKAIPKLLKKLAPVELHENIYTLPNILTTTRIITAPIISYALLNSQPALAFGLFAYSSITDLVDGFLARRYNMGTVLGSILDPFADKLLMTVTTISLYAIGTFPWWLALIILGRDGGLLLSALYFRWISLPPPRTMTRYWDFSLPSAEVRPTEISKINTLLQFLLVADAVLLPVLSVSLVESWNLWGVFEGWMGLVAGTTIWSGMSYLFTKDAIRFIGQDKEKK